MTNDSMITLTDELNIPVKTHSKIMFKKDAFSDACCFGFGLNCSPMNLESVGINQQNCEHSRIHLSTFQK